MFYNLHRKKLKEPKYCPYPTRLLKYGERGEPEARVFKGLKYNQMRTCFKLWLKDAGIKKNITFHSFRHTYATLQLEFGTELYTVSKLLGHRSIKTTQRFYAKVKDKLQVEAVSRIKLDMQWHTETNG